MWLAFAEPRRYDNHDKANPSCLISQPGPMGDNGAGEDGRLALETRLAQAGTHCPSITTCDASPPIHLATTFEVSEEGCS
jgi:hypothetical protein